MKHKQQKQNKYKVKTQGSTKSLRSYHKIQQQSDPRAWLKIALRNIQDQIAEQAPILLKKYRQKVAEKGGDYDKPLQLHKSYDLLKAQENEIRQKLRKIKELQKTTKKSVRHTNFKPIVKSNSQLRKIAKKYKQFKQSLMQKSRLIRIQQQQQKQKQVLLKQEHKKTQCEQRRKNIQQTLRNMELRRKNRLQQHRKQREALKELKKQKLFQKMKQNFNKQMNELNEEKLKNYERKKQSYTVDMSTLSSHEKNYEQQKLQRQQKRSVRLNESRMLPSIHHYQSKFHDQVLQQEEKKKQRMKQLEQRGKKMIEKHKKYQQYVSEEFAPKIKSPNQSSDDEDKQNKKINPLDYKQMISKGNQYLKQAHKKTIPTQRRKQLQKIKQVQEVMLAKQKKSYPNYLSQILKKSQTHKKLRSNVYQGEVKRIQNIIGNKNIKREHKLEEVKTAIHKMSFSFQPNIELSQQQILNKLNAKMKLLEMLQ